jgi:hypothetical protein
MGDGPAIGDSLPPWRIYALRRRIHLLEEQALTVRAAWPTAATNASLRTVLSTLHRAETWLTVRANPEVVVQIEDMLLSVGEQLSDLGRSLDAAPAPLARVAVAL